MSSMDEFQETKSEVRVASLYQWFERAVVLFLTFLIAIVVVAAVWTLSLKILFGLVLTGSLDPSDFEVFQAVFGMIFTVIIALEFKKSLLVVAERREAVVQIRSVVLIALLAVCRKIIILDLNETDAVHTLALATVILALGVVYWLIRASDCRQEEAA
ncbi:phosphate-starvation-inducible PsiE family protein [Bradyrhizobium sp. CCBAU 11357]|uniref:phosphate-starvation-inducible PsiE family protein n=1 Tax=Bradyrhizobium sp. CCBAU 11357 TaxID=1630808 RepID=UPI002303D043|nr:phosphate-starvation-inducible PsiE family protein [Bradyrhizobium sp. CCBAU 11357]MDA9500122.1 protein PsiE [Bradyrhizobium sp. CCBAU 11357]